MKEKGCGRSENSVHDKIREVANNERKNRITKDKKMRTYKESWEMNQRGHKGGNYLKTAYMIKYLKLLIVKREKKNMNEHNEKEDRM